MKLQSRKSCVSLLRKYGTFLTVVAPAVVVSYLLMKFGLMFHQDSLTLNEKFDFLMDYNDFTPSGIKCLVEVFVGVFVKGSDYVGPLWTIRYEVFGTIITYPLAYYVYANKHRGIYTYAFVTILLMRVSQNLVAFMLGAGV